MVSIARKNLFHDRVRFLAAVVGIQFAVVLITVQLGLFLKFLTSASVIIDHTDGDIWISSKNLKNFDFSRPISEKTLHQSRQVNGVESAQSLLLGFAQWKMPDGGQESIQLVGYNPETMVGAPWNIVEGDPYSVKYFNSVFIDEADLDRLGNLGIGEETEISSRKVRIAGITRGARSFIGSPYVFTSFKNAIILSERKKGETNYVVVKVTPGQNTREVQDRLQRELPDVDVYTKGEFSAKTRSYWLITTGIGIALFCTACMGFFIGAIIVGQTIYTSTVEHIKEFGTLKAIGASNMDIYRIIVEQATVTAAIGFGIGMLTAHGAIEVMRIEKLDVYLPWQAIVAISFATLLMCVGSSIISVLKAVRIDPALVFKG